MKNRPPNLRYVICLHNRGYEVSLERLKLYVQCEPQENDPPIQEMVRVVDESGEDYLFPADWFLPLALPAAVIDAIADSETREYSGYVSVVGEVRDVEDVGPVDERLLPRLKRFHGGGA